MSIEARRVSDPLDLDLQVVMRHPAWVLGMELRSSARAVYALNCWAISLIHITQFFLLLKK